MTIEVVVGKKKIIILNPGKHETIRGLLTANDISVCSKDLIYVDNVTARPESDCRGVRCIEITPGAHTVKLPVFAGVR